MKSPRKQSAKPAKHTTERIKLSDEISAIQIGTVELQSKSLNQIIEYFRWTTWAILIFIAIAATVEHFFSSSTTETKIITDKVVITAIAGAAVQSGAIIIAAFKGLFSK